MSFYARLKAMEESLLHLPAGDSEETQYVEFQRRFEAADPIGAKVIRLVASKIVGSRDARLYLLRRTVDGGIRSDLAERMGKFAKANRLKMPGAKVIHVRNGVSKIIPAPNPEASGARFLQIMADGPFPKRQETTL